MLRLSGVLFCILLTACQPDTTAPAANALALQLQFAGKPLGCSDDIALAGTDWRIQQLQFYLADFAVDGQPQPLQADGIYQQEDLALAGSVCDGNDNWQLRFKQPLPAGTLQFTLGVPAQLNHQDPLLAKPPLNQSELFWSWQQGYKYLRLDLQAKAHNTASVSGGWSLHLGATGCQSPSPLRAPASPCLAANLARISLTYKPGQTLQLDLAPLLQGLTPAADNHCMADPNRKSCQLLLPRLGLGAQQQIWSLQ